MQIRRAGVEDIPSLLELLEQVLAKHAEIRPDLFIPHTTKYDKRELSLIVNNEETPVFVCEEERVIAYAFVVKEILPQSRNMYAQKNAYLDDLCVDEAYRGKGIAGKLLAYVEEEMRKEGIASLTLNVWEGNEEAKSFYEKEGCRIRKTMMEKEL